jgi:hypothetical protein
MDDSVPKEIAIAAEEHAGDVQGEIYELLDEIVDSAPGHLRAPRPRGLGNTPIPKLSRCRKRAPPEARLAISVIRDLVANAFCLRERPRRGKLAALGSLTRPLAMSWRPFLLSP